ncbi:hypothetical protein BJX68DRAFT_3062 [Aspergillus pseudodeflectus]|uniref:Uncharacterized protein n=1 Tax=Aspergillus pseudodeflectus TaxID=176178 RepID=A0ABR4LA11_9EURO
MLALLGESALPIRPPSLERNGHRHCEARTRSSIIIDSACAYLADSLSGGLRGGCVDCCFNNASIVTTHEFNNQRPSPPLALSVPKPSGTEPIRGRSVRVPGFMLAKTSARAEFANRKKGKKSRIEQRPTGRDRPGSVELIPTQAWFLPRSHPSVLLALHARAGIWDVTRSRLV